MHDRYSEEALKSQHGKTIPLRLGVKGRIIGTATLRYNSEAGELWSDIRIDDPVVAEQFSDDKASALVLKRES
jgi:hypothetical protein